MLVVGTSAQKQRQCFLDRLSAGWGEAWFDKIPESFRREHIGHDVVTPQ
jgi:hypothetical protein